MLQFPADADGDALRRVAEGGSDMSKPMTVEFAVAVADEPSGQAIAEREAAAAAGFTTSLTFDDQSDEGTCYCSAEMLATYDDLIRVQQELRQLASSDGGDVDGWQTAGNVS